MTASTFGGVTETCRRVQRRDAETAKYAEAVTQKPRCASLTADSSEDAERLPCLQAVRVSGLANGRSSLVEQSRNPIGADALAHRFPGRVRIHRTRTMGDQQADDLHLLFARRIRAAAAAAGVLHGEMQGG